MTSAALAWAAACEGPEGFDEAEGVPLSAALEDNLEISIYPTPIGEGRYRFTVKLVSYNS